MKKRDKTKSVRLRPEEIETIKKSLSAIDPTAKVYLFGSRTDPNEQGGDIDLLILSKRLKRKDIRPVRRNFFDRFGEQKIDIVLDDGTLKSAFVKMIFPKAVAL